MNSSDQQEKFPLWVFITADLTCLALAAAIAGKSTHPMPTSTVLAIVGLVALGVGVGLVPLILRLERQKNAALDERQSALEGLGRTVTSSAEQISIAANGLHEIAELAQRNLRQAEQLPQKLQEKIAEFQAQLSTASDTEKEELERELLALRTSESERLDAVSQRIAKSSADWAKLETATQQHLTAANEALGKLAMGTANAIGKAQAAAEQALTQARTEAARTLGETSGQAARSLETAKAAALSEIDAKVAEAASGAAERVARELQTRVSTTLHTLDEKIARLEAAVAAAGSAAEAIRTATPPAPAPTPAQAPEAQASAAPVASLTPIAAAGESGSAPAPAETASTPTPPPKRPRKQRREEPAAEPAPVAAETEAAPSSEAISAASEPAAAGETSSIAPAPAEEPPPVPPEKIVEVAPVAPATAEPFNGHLAASGHENGSRRAETVAADVAPAELPEPTSAADSVSPVEETATADAAVETGIAAAGSPEPEAPPPAPARRRTAKKPAADDEPGLDLDLGDTTVREPSPTERVLTSDGATRLIVTAYIGIGNRLFIRGEGPGLSWEKGVPLQFVSIGKWRWETAEANNPVQFKLYKNDDLECAALGAQTLDPGHQQEVTAAF